MILFDATPLQSEHRLRGLGRYTQNLARELVNICPDNIRFAVTKRDLHLLPDSIRARAIPSHRPHRPAQVYWIYNEWFLRNIAKRVRPSVFHSTDFNGLIKPRGMSTVATLHDMTVLKEGLRHTDLSGRMSDLRWWVYYYQKLPKAAHIIAISEAVKRDAMELLDIPVEKITVIPHGIDTNRFQPVNCQKRSEKRYLLFVGGTNENKNLVRVLKALSALTDEFPDLLLFIAGAWSTQDLQWLKNLCSDRKIEASVKHLGYVPDNELASLYSHAEALVFPSLQEGFGLPILEAMCCGTPVITSKRGAMWEVAGQAARLVNPESVEDLTAGIRDLLTKPILKEHLIKLGLARASQYSWTEAARKTYAVYRSLQNFELTV